jgi:hypothetical protein
MSAQQIDDNKVAHSRIKNCTSRSYGTGIVIHTLQRFAKNKYHLSKHAQKDLWRTRYMPVHCNRFKKRTITMICISKDFLKVTQINMNHPL